MPPSFRSGLLRRRLWLISTVAIVVLMAFAYAMWWSQPVVMPPLAAAQWVDEQQCQGCHATQVQDWQGSHHHMAMQLASAETVLADFTAAPLRTPAETTVFKRKGEEFWVNLPGADGQSADFKVAYTFGVSPLQQYLLALPDGRLQALGAAWDVERQQWFHLYPQAEHGDAMHWSGALQNANAMCIECHTTGFERGFDDQTNSFASRWQALGVGCQSCHGPASNHLLWAADPQGVAGSGRGLTVNLKDAGNQAEVETCARCHSRRATLGGGYHATNRLHDDYQPSPLAAGLYEVDGKIQDEVFEYGSFTQSRMHTAGVRCSDCHNPHSGELRASGNAVCTQCHNPSGRASRSDIRMGGLQARDYQAPAHHHHPVDSAGAQCQSCHMPGRYYMGNDLRHDHSFSRPNPAQALELGHGDACLGCHQQDDAGKIVEQFQAWYGMPAPADGGYARALSAAREGRAGAASALYAQLARTDLPGLRKAALLAELPQYPTPQVGPLLVAALRHPESAVRLAAIDVVAAMTSPEQQVQALGPLLRDARRAVRLAATWQLAQLPPALLQSLPRWPAALADYEQAQRAQLDRAEALTNLATLYQLTQRSEQVEPSLRLALQRNPQFHPARLLLAQWLEAQGQAEQGIALLRESTVNYPSEASLHHALGLALVRQGQRQDALKALRLAYELASENGDYAYVLAVALHDSGQVEAALALLREQLAQAPANRSLRMALISYLRAAGDVQQAGALFAELASLNPQDPLLR
jgi:predicted CXXCH cytochrome family protein